MIMKQALKMIEEITRKKDALKSTSSKYLKRDYSRSIWSDLQELKEYCSYKGIDYESLIKQIERK